MKFEMIHVNRNVLDLDASIAFYRDALGFKEIRRSERADFTNVFLSDGVSPFQVELTYLKERTEPYNLGDNEIHLAVRTDDYEGAKALHQKMGCICYENHKMNLYFINDPDDYWIEILPANRGSGQSAC
jgi:lactoylglutathione lyase